LQLNAKLVILLLYILLIKGDIVLPSSSIFKRKPLEQSDLLVNEAAIRNLRGISILAYESLTHYI